MANKHTFLTYNIWNGDLHKGFDIDHRGLNSNQIQQAINEYIVNQSEEKREIKRLNSLVDNLLIEYQKYKKYYEDDFDRRNSN